jgi:hypothetical protein
VYQVAQRAVALEEMGRLEGDLTAGGIPPGSRILEMEAQVNIISKEGFVVFHQLERSHHERIRW